MSGDQREEVMGAVRSALAGVGEKAVLPDYEDEMVVVESRLERGDLWADFSSNFEEVNGRAMRSVAELVAFLEEQDCARGYCDPALKGQVGEALEKAGLDVEYEFERERYDDYGFGITRASGAIAESGTVVLNDFDTVDRLAALAPWVHVAVLREESLVRTIPDGLAVLGEAPNIVWVTGPSKTGDIEGILIEGVHGPGEQVCLCLG